MSSNRTLVPKCDFSDDHNTYIYYVNMESIDKMLKTIHDKRTMDLAIQEICMTCISQGFNASEFMARHAVTILTSDCMMELAAMKPLELTEVINWAVDYLMSMKGIKFKILLVQSYYGEEFKNEEHVMEQRVKLLNSYAAPILKSVLMNHGVRPNYDIIHRHIVFLTIIMTGMGDPTDQAVYGEAEVALASLMSAQDIIKFTQLSQLHKRRQVQEVIKLVAGIRIYNRAKIGQTYQSTLKEQDDVDDLPKLLAASFTSLKSTTEQISARLTKSVVNLEKAMEDCYEWDLQLGNPLKFVKPFSKEREDFDTGVKLLFLWQQISVVLRKMLENIEQNLREQVKSDDDMKNKILLMIDKLAYKVGVPSKEVFPDFLEFYQHWKGCQKRLVFVNKYDKMLKKMRENINVSNLPMSVKRAAEDEFWPMDESIRPIAVGSESVEVVLTRPAPQVEYNGFCPVWLTLTEGILLAANIEIGVLKYQERFFGFRDANAAELFSNSPNKYLYGVYSIARRHPEYVGILNLKGEHIFGWSNNDFTPNGKQQMKDETVQTEIHPIAKHRDYSYNHSVWRLKEIACHQVDLRNKKSSSSQTWSEHRSIHVTTQTCRDEESGGVSLKDKSTSAQLECGIYTSPWEIVMKNNKSS